MLAAYRRSDPVYLQSRRQFIGSPIEPDNVKFLNWYGNTNFAYANKSAYYSQLQGLHSGLDFACKSGTLISNSTNKIGEVISVDGKPYDYKAGPHSVLIDYGDVIVLYGHVSATNLPAINTKIVPGSKIAESGTDGFFEHLHMEVLKKNIDSSSSSRPVEIRTNPVPYFSPEDLQVLKGLSVWDTFHSLSGESKWQSPEDQPDINPGGKILVP